MSRLSMQKPTTGALSTRAIATDLRSYRNPIFRHAPSDAFEKHRIISVREYSHDSCAKLRG